MVEAANFDPQRGLFLVTFNPYRFQTAKLRLLLTGTFNQWNYEHQGVTGLYLGKTKPEPVSIFLQPGYYEYKYFDLESGQWLEAETAPEVYWGSPENFCWNPYGTRNCWLQIG